MAEMKELIILPPKRGQALPPVLYVEDRPDPKRCPYCRREFEVIIGCRKWCACGYLEGCED